MFKKIFIICLLGICSNIAFSQTYVSVTTVKTPNGSTVPDTRQLTSSDITYSSSQLAALREDLRVNYNGAVLIDAPSYKYNCHAYAWHISEGGDKVWIGYSTSTAEDVYWTDGSYVEVSESEATKVSYNQAGNHSAIRLNSTYYQSKWGSSALVKHTPNAVPSGYHPEMTKKYYKRNLPNMSISGQQFVCGSAEYSVKNLPSDATVTWRYEASDGGGSPTILQNTPSTNSCTIYNNGSSRFFVGYIKADINIGGTVVKTVLKNINGDSNSFSGFYKELSDDGSWVPDNSVSLGEPNYATPPKTIVIESDNFKGKTVTCTASGSTSVLQVQNNYVMFEMPNLPNGQLLTIRVSGSDCSSPVSFTFAARSSYSLSTTGLQIAPLDDDSYVLSVSATDDADVARRVPALEDNAWSFSVYNAVDLTPVMTKNVTADKYILNTSSWTPGVYVVRAVINGKTYSGKIAVK